MFERTADGSALIHDLPDLLDEALVEGGFNVKPGFVTEAGRQSVPLSEAMAMTGHQSSQTVIRYFQTGAVQQSAAANLMKQCSLSLGKDAPHE